MKNTHYLLHAILVFTRNISLFKNKVFTIAILLLIGVTSLTAQEAHFLEEWYETTGTSEDFINNVITKYDNQGNTYVAGSTLIDAGTYDMILTKYSKIGSKLWSKQFNIGSKNAVVGDMTLDNNQRPIIVGSAYNNGNNSYDMFTVKYNGGGTKLWHKINSGTKVGGYDGGVKVVCDASNRIYVTGGVTNNSTLFDFVTIRYNSNGTQQWVAQYDSGHLNDASGLITILDNNNILVTGISEIYPNVYEYTSVTYNHSNGAQLGAETTEGLGTIIQKVNDATVDNQQNIYITGAAHDGETFNMKTIKLNNNLEIVWNSTYSDQASKNDVSNAIELDESGNVYITGYSNLKGSDQMVTIKYLSNGEQSWVKINEETVASEGKALVYDEVHGLFVTGYIADDKGKDFSINQYKDSNGDEIWSSKFNGVYNKDEEASQINVGDDGGVVISGKSGMNDGTSSYLTVKYRKHELIIPPDDESVSTAMNYIENKGQLQDTDNNIATDVKFYTEGNSTATYFHHDKVSMVLSDSDGDDTTPDHLYRVDMIFNDDPAVRERIRVSPLDKRNDYHNYYLGHIQEGREGVRLFDKLVIPEIYDGIDAIHSSNNAGMKHYFVIKSGADPTDIELTFEGQNGLSITNGELVMSTTLGDIVLPQPKAYKIQNEQMIEYNWTPDYSINNSKVIFSVGNYNELLPLVITIGKDESSTSTSFSSENLDWCTHMGGASRDVIEGISKGNDGIEDFVCFTGWTQSFDFPVSPGGFFFNTGTIDAITGKFNIDGVRRWISFFGGNTSTSSTFSANDFGNAIAADNAANIYFGGTSWSSNFIVDAGVNGTGLDLNNFSGGGGSKAFLIRLNANTGFRTWSTFYGGDGHAQTIITSMEVNSQGNVFFAGDLVRHEPASGVITTFPIIGKNEGYYVKVDAAGNEDENVGSAFIGEMDPNINLIWSTLLGANNGLVGNNGNTRIKDLAIDNNDDIILVGVRSGTNIDGHEFVNSGGTFVNIIIGGNDGLIMKFSHPARQPTWSTLFGGTNGDDITGVDTDGGNRIYMTGTTTSSGYDGFPLEAFNISDDLVPNDISFTGGQDNFLSRFTSTGGLEWCSYYGGSGSEKEAKVTIDSDDNVYFTGSSNSVDLDLLELTDAYYQPLLNQPDYDNNPSASAISDGSYDNYFMVVNGLLQKQWATFLGGHTNSNEDKDIIKDIVTYDNRYLYFTGITDNGNDIKFPTQDLGNPSFYREFNSGGDEGTIGRFGVEGLFDFSTSEENINKENFGFKIYPNPTNSYFTIDSGDTNKRGTLTIMDIYGRLLLTKELSSISNRQRIDISGFSKGIYYVHLEIEGKESIQKLIVQ